ncbi:hypothetical protein KP509_11G040300 [Ceratopteris richardii]|uniref:RING-type E3 ubiquitin transferase n=1 Tax=Ceratopteris richardii TaxID=49495 RepID=A0A8T2TRQ5_CERRI|nr:hypothetical protein KP509_11G040300 [Ceratopteris richardii]KAH7425108.1 hypothetical protein KP509_11G040300 [Ceratopteris richardii]KAH7425109.1 hypothetical protein KP509_11G040300 [Ceratopteris richardii]KAH7425110.1 hypothetical protein KP509_11G040300 [Ceratopteris richardii]
MPHSQSTRTSVFGMKSNGIIRASKMLADNDERCGYGCGNSRHRPACGAPSSYLNNFSSSRVVAPVKQDYLASSSSSSSDTNHRYPFSTIQTITLAGSNELGLDFNAGSDNSEIQDCHGTVKNSNLTEVCVSSINDVYKGQKEDDSLILKGGSFIQYKGLESPVSQSRYVSQPEKLHAFMNKQSVIDDSPQRILPSCAYHMPCRKGSSSKAPMIDDLSVPLSLNKSRPITDSFKHEENQGCSLVSMAELGSKNKCAPTAGMVGYSYNSNATVYNRRKTALQTCCSHQPRSGDLSVGQRDIGGYGAGLGRRGLSNLVCSSAADVLPSVSSSVISNYACSSATDALSSAPNSLTGTIYLPSKKSSKTLSMLDDEEAEGSYHFVNTMFGMKEENDRQIVQAQDQTHGYGLTTLQSTQASYNPQSRSEPLRIDAMTNEMSLPNVHSLLPTDSQWGRNTPTPRNGGCVGSIYRSRHTFDSSISIGDEMSNHRPARRSLYGGHSDPVNRDRQSSGRILSQARHSSSSCSILQHAHNPQSRLAAVPPRRHPPPPLAVSTGRAIPECNSSASRIMNSEFIQASRSTNSGVSNDDAEWPSTAHNEAGFFNRSTSSENRPRLTVEGLSEILSALDYIERDEGVSYEQMLMLEATILLGGIGLHDRYRDLRIDIDNMSYEELLALEERIGSVNTGLSEETITKCLRVEFFIFPNVSQGYIPQEVEIKCSICQEEFEEAVELGVLECGHSYHIDCIWQWLLQKNQCPICKASALSNLT